jgi:ADP-ribose pyrophosphatase YjhB (NUDIX family)
VSVAGIVVRDDGSVLAIQRRDNAHWEPPGGVLELAESFEDGVRREVLEETGVAVCVERLTGVYKNVPKGVVALVFRCRPLAGSPMPTEESRCTRWLSVEEVLELMTPAYAVRVLDAFEAGTSTRSHDGVHLIQA